MANPHRRKWRFQFSLRTFLLSCLLVGGPVAWLSHAYHEYQAEQRLIQAMAARTPPGTVMTVEIDGETISSLESLLM